MKTVIARSSVILLTLASGQQSLAAEPAQTVATWSTDCLGDKEAQQGGAQSFGLAVAAVLAPKAAQVAFDAVGAAIKASADTNTVLRESQPTYTKFYLISPLGEAVPHFSCLTVRKGIYLDSDYALAGGERTLGPFSDKDQIYIELKLEQDPKDKNFLRFRPVAFNVNAFEDSSFWKSDRRIDIQVDLKSMYSDKNFGNVAITFNAVNKGLRLDSSKSRLAFAISTPFRAPDLEDLKPVLEAQGKVAKDRLLAASYIEKAGVTHDFTYQTDSNSVYSVGNTRQALVQYCSRLRPPTSDPLCTDWALHTPQRDALLSKFAAAEKSNKLKANRLTWAAEKCKNYAADKGPISCFPDDIRNKYLQAGYISTKASISHTRDANKFGVALAKAISDSSADLSKLAAEQLPQAKQERQEAQKTAARKQTQDIIISERELEIARHELDVSLRDNPDDNAVLQHRLNVVKAMLKVNNAYYAAGEAPPYPQYE